MTVQHENKTYYVDGLSGSLKTIVDKASKERKSHILFDQPEAVCIYNHKNFQGNPNYLGDAVGILQGLRQPTADQVRNAMIWATGYAGEKFDYAIKAGGESNSDSMFSSSLTVMIAHPKTGLDTDVLILKKFSTNFQDVLITEDEVRALYKMCQTPAETEKVNQSKVEGGVALLWRSFQGFKINISGKSRKATATEINSIEQFLFKVGTDEAIEAHINRMIKNRARDLSITLNEKASSSTTKEFHAEAREKIALLQEFKVSLLQNSQAA